MCDCQEDKLFSEECINSCVDNFEIAENKANYTVQKLKETWVMGTDLALYYRNPLRLCVEIYNRNWNVSDERLCYAVYDQNQTRELIKSLKAMEDEWGMNQFGIAPEYDLQKSSLLAFKISN